EPRPTEVGPHRPFRLAEDLGDLGPGEVLPVEELDDHLIAERQPAQGREEEALLRPASEGRARARREVMDAGDLEIDRLTPARGVEALHLVVGDPEEVGAQAALAAPALTRLDEREERRLDEILDLGR